MRNAPILALVLCLLLAPTADGSSLPAYIYLPTAAHVLDGWVLLPDAERYQEFPNGSIAMRAFYLPTTDETVEFWTASYDDAALAHNFLHDVGHMYRAERGASCIPTSTLSVEFEEACSYSTGEGYWLVWLMRVDNRAAVVTAASRLNYSTKLSITGGLIQSDLIR